MAGTVPIRIIAFLLTFLWSAASIALCQQRETRSADSLPDAPSIQSSEPQTLSQGHSSQTLTLQSFENAAHLPVTALPLRDWDLHAHFNIGHFQDSQPLSNEESSSDPVTRYLSARPFPASITRHAWAGDSFVGRIGSAASSIFVTHDAAGESKLNTRYLLAVLTSAAAHSARTPYWRRSVSQPLSDFGATIGNDAGMNVFHAFEPGLRQALKSHEPKFVIRVEEHFHHD
jgi:hypothetical protein